MIEERRRVSGIVNAASDLIIGMRTLEVVEIARPASPGARAVHAGWHPPCQSRFPSQSPRRNVVLVEEHERGDGVVRYQIEPLRRAFRDTGSNPRCVRGRRQCPYGVRYR
jgi:hypothetical protein